jgi:N-methylhydantoinase A
VLVFDGARIGSRATLAGPVIVEQPTTTILLLEGQHATVDQHGNLPVKLS